MKILVIADSKIPVPPTGYGGTERIVGLLCEGLARRGHSVTLMAARGSRNFGRLIPYPWAGKKPYPYRAYCKIRFQVQSWLASQGVNVVINFARVDYLHAILRERVPLIHCFQNPIQLFEVNFLTRLRKEALTLVSISDHQRAHLSLSELWRTIYNGVDLSKFPHIEEPGRDSYLTFLGRLTHNKGAHLAIAVAKATGWRLKIAGNISDEPGGRRFFESEVRPHLDGHIEWIGEVDDARKARLLGGAAALLAPVQWDEPFGIVVAEALACGTPVIATKRGAMPEIVRHGLTGFLVEDAQQMATAVGRVETLSRQACRRDCEDRFSADLMVDKYLDVHRDLVNCNLSVAA